MDAVKGPDGFYRLEYVRCGKERCKKCREGKGHGPYWYRYWWEGGKTHKKYVGKNLPAYVMSGSDRIVPESKPHDRVGGGTVETETARPASKATTQNTMDEYMERARRWG